MNTSCVHVTQSSGSTNVCRYISLAKYLLFFRRIFLFINNVNANKINWWSRIKGQSNARIKRVRVIEGAKCSGEGVFMLDGRSNPIAMVCVIYGLNVVTFSDALRSNNERLGLNWN